MFLKLTLSDDDGTPVYIKAASIASLCRLQALDTQPARTCVTGNGYVTGYVKELPEEIMAMISCSKVGRHVYNQLCDLVHSMDALAASMESSHRAGDTLPYGKARRHVTDLMGQLENILNGEGE